MKRTNPKPKTSQYRGVSWSAQKRRWRLDVRAAKVRILCETELQAAMMYNAVARVLWPGEKLNSLPRPVYTEEFGQTILVSDKPRKLCILDQEPTEETTVGFFNLYGVEWFFHKGFVRRTQYVPHAGGFLFETINDCVFRGPSRHRDGNTLDNRRVNLVALHDPDGEPLMLGDPATRDAAFQMQPKPAEVLPENLL